MLCIIMHTEAYVHVHTEGNVHVHTEGNVHAHTEGNVHVHTETCSGCYSCVVHCYFLVSLYFFLSLLVLVAVLHGGTLTM